MRADFRLGDWIIRPRNDCIERGDEVVHIHPRPMEVLECLAAADGGVVTRNELFDTVWPGVIVTDDALTQCIVELRKAFGDDAHDPQIIKTIPKVGFCLIPKVSPLSGDEESPVPVAEPEVAGKVTTPARKILITAAAIVVAISIIFYFVISGENDSAGPTQSELAIAVLPFADLSEAGDQGWFADGLSEELINMLAGVDGLNVTSRASSFSFRGAIEDMGAITKTLGVTHILEGSVRVDGDHLRITAQLIDASSGFHLWSGAYNHELEDVLTAQQEISAAVVQALKDNVVLQPGSALAAAASVKTEAREAVVLGRYLVGKRTVAALQGAVQTFEKAIEIEPDYAVAHAELAMAIRLLWYNRRDFTRVEAQSRAAPHAGRALELDPGLAEAWAASAWVTGVREDRLKYYQRAIRINPGYSIAYTWMARELVSYGRYGEAFAALQKAVKLDPLSIPAITNYVVELIARNRLDEAAGEVEKLALLRPDTHSRLRGVLAGSGGKYSTRVLGALDALLLNPDIHNNRAFLARYWAMMGLEQEALTMRNPPSAGTFLMLGKAEDGIKIQEQRLLKNPDGEFTRRNLGVIYAAAGDYQRARPLLEELWKLGGGQISRAGVFRGREAEALIDIRRTAGEEHGARELLAAMEKYVQELKDAGINGTNMVVSVDYLAGVTAYLSGQRETGLSLIAEAVEKGAFIPPASAYLHTLYDDPGFARIRELQQARVIRERKRFLTIVCADNPYQEVWQPADGTCERLLDSADRI